MSNANLLNSNAVAVANRFNPSIFSHHWFIKNQLIGEDTSISGSVFTDEVVQLSTDSVQLQVMQPQLSVTPKELNQKSRKVSGELLKSIFRLLPETPVFALGLNCNWRLPSESKTKALSKSLFYVEDRPLFKSFNSDDCYFGSYMSKAEAGGRLKLTVRPLTFKHGDSNSESIDFLFNFHIDIDLNKSPDDRLLLLENHLDQWENIVNRTQEIVAEVDVLNE